MVMKASPRTALKVIQPQVILGALEVLFNAPAGAAQLQATGFGRAPMKMGQAVVIRFGIAGRPVDHQPSLFQFAPGLAQVMLQKDLAPSELRPQTAARNSPLLPLA